MTFKLVFKVDAKKEWDSLDSTVRSIFAEKLKERIGQPRIKSARLGGMKDCYKIKLRRAGYRLVYQVRDKELIVSVIAVGKRERNQVTRRLLKEFSKRSQGTASALLSFLYFMALRKITWKYSMILSPL